MGYEELVCGSEELLVCGRELLVWLGVGEFTREGTLLEFRLLGKRASPPMPPMSRKSASAYR